VRGGQNKNHPKKREIRLPGAKTGGNEKTHQYNRTIDQTIKKEKTRRKERRAEHLGVRRGVNSRGWKVPGRGKDKGYAKRRRQEWRCGSTKWVRLKEEGAKRQGVV